MSDETSVDDLFGDDKPKRKPRERSKHAAVTHPKPAAKAVSKEPIDNAVNIRRLDWECECGNTNTLDLQRCGKCNKHRFTTN